MKQSISTHEKAIFSLASKHNGSNFQTDTSSKCT